jgi:hypothetical protein
VAITALVLWMCTAAAGAYLLTAGIRTRQPGPPAASRPQPEPEPVTAPAAKPVRARDRFDPPSLTRAKSEPLPGLRALAEFTHPALAIIGFGFWLGYVLSKDRVFAAIGFGVLLGAICAGLTWYASNTRAARGAAKSGDALSFPARLIILHAVGAVLTLLFVTLIAARV